MTEPVQTTLGVIIAVLLAFRPALEFYDRNKAKKNGGDKVAMFASCALARERYAPLMAVSNATKQKLDEHHAEVAVLRSEFRSMAEGQNKMIETLGKIREHTRDTWKTMERMDERQRKNGG